MLDMFTKMVLLRAAEAPTSIVEWSSQHGLPDWMVSDGGSHFQNSVLADLCQVYHVNHHVTTPYCPWANGSAERMVQEVLRALRKLISEFQMNLRDWPSLLPMVQFSLNHFPRKQLGRRSPIEVAMGRKPSSPVSMVFRRGHCLADAV